MGFNYTKRETDQKTLRPVRTAVPSEQDLDGAEMNAGFEKICSDGLALEGKLPKLFRGRAPEQRRGRLCTHLQEQRCCGCQNIRLRKSKVDLHLAGDLTRR
jgi:hypothetical protein